MLFINLKNSYIYNQFTSNWIYGEVAEPSLPIPKHNDVIEFRIFVGYVSAVIVYIRKKQNVIQSLPIMAISVAI